MQYHLIRIQTRYDKLCDKGGLSFFEGMRAIPFEIKRVYYIHGVAAGEMRGRHAHKTLQQVLFCPYGSVRIRLNNGYEEETVLLDDPSVGLVLEPGLWRTMEWLVDNSVLCVAASEYYAESDYIRDYSDFLKYVKEKDEHGSKVYRTEALV